MKIIVLVYIMASLSLSSIAWANDEIVGVPSIEARPLEKEEKLESLVHGPLLTERTTLLKEIKECEDKGIGIQNYLISFRNVESMVKNNAPEASIRARVELIRVALEAQLRQQRQSIKPPVPANGTSPTKLMTLEAARMYMLDLVNADRVKHHRSRLSLDPVASATAQTHCDEMATYGYFSHWDMSGKKFWQRYTEARGTDGIIENLASIGELGLSGKLRPASYASFSAEELQQMESSFMREQPPYDHHRTTILAPEANKVGIGLSCAMNSSGFRECLAQEFVNAYGQYSPLPKSIVCSKPFEVAGSLISGAKIYSVSVDWEPSPKPMSAEELRGTYECSHGDTLMADISIENEPGAIKSWTKGERQHFAVQIFPTKDWKPGLYHVEITAMPRGFKKPVVVSVRSVTLSD